MQVMRVYRPVPNRSEKNRGPANSYIGNHNPRLKSSRLPGRKLLRAEVNQRTRKLPCDLSNEEVPSVPNPQTFNAYCLTTMSGYWTDSAESKFGHIYKGIFPYHVRVGEIKNAGNLILTRRINANVSQVYVL